jgi:hypothetical protein
MWVRFTVVVFGATFVMAFSTGSEMAGVTCGGRGVS